MRAADEARVKALKPIKGKFKTLVVDPPWDYEWLSIARREEAGAVWFFKGFFGTLDRRSPPARRVVAYLNTRPG